MESFRRRCTGVRLETRHGAYKSIPSGIPPDGTRNPRQRRSRFLLFSPDMHIPTIAAKAIVLAGIERVLCMKCLLSRTVLHIVIQQIGSCPTPSKAEFSIPIPFLTENKIRPDTCLHLASSCYSYPVSDKRNVSNADDDPQIGSVANQLVHPAADFGNQKTVFQGIALVLCSSANFQKNLLVESNNSPDILIQFSFHVVLGCL